MKRLVAVWVAKLASFVGLLMGKMSTATPGVLAMKIYPDLIRDMSKEIEKGIIIVCGTNGKTTTNNLINTTLKKSGFKTVCNSIGANMTSGVATAFIQECNLLGKFKADYGVFEVDEAYARYVFDHLTPTCMVVTNLFRDQLDRYGKIEMTLQLIDEAIRKVPGIKLVLNGDDPISSTLGEGRDAHYFGVNEKVLPDLEKSPEGRFCIKCGNPQEYNYLHYNQLGDYYCPACGNKRPNLDFAADNVDLTEVMRFRVNSDNIAVNYRGFYNIYNILALYSTLKVMDIKINDINEILSDYKPQIGRMELIDLGKPFILNLAKNPAGFNQAIQTVELDKRRKDIILAINDTENDGRDVSWIWDVDFEKLSDGTLNTLSVSGDRLYDLALRFKYFDIPVSHVTKNMRSAINKAMESEAEVCYVLANYTAVFPTQKLMLEIQKEQKNRRLEEPKNDARA